MKTNATVEQLKEALNHVNTIYDNNIIFNRFDVNARSVNFTLKVRDSQKPGHRLGFSKTSLGNRRKMASSCWHVHGNFFEYLFGHCTDIYIRAGQLKMESNRDNWQDRNIGSNYEPLYFSEACDCE